MAEGVKASTTTITWISHNICTTSLFTVPAISTAAQTNIRHFTFSLRRKFLHSHKLLRANYVTKMHSHFHIFRNCRRGQFFAGIRPNTTHSSCTHFVQETSSLRSTEMKEINTTFNKWVNRE